MAPSSQQRSLVKEVRTLNKGRCLVAYENLAPGVEVFSCQADAWAVDVAHRATTCNFCLKQAAVDQPHKRCTGCKVLQYCSTTCQQRDWLEHKAECKALRRLSAVTPPTTLLIVARLIKRMLPARRSNTEGDPELVTSLAKLASNYSRFSKERIQLMREMASLVRDVLRYDTEVDMLRLGLLGPDFVVKLLCQLQCNGFTITTSEGEPVGTGLFLGAANVNHSCSPNCYALFHGTTLHLRTIRPVARDEELCIGYVEVTAPRSVRQTLLRASYMFDCSCMRCQCSEEWLREGMMEALRCKRKGCRGGCVPVGRDEADIYRAWMASRRMQKDEGRPERYICVLCGSEVEMEKKLEAALALAQHDMREAADFDGQGKLGEAKECVMEAYSIMAAYLHPMNSRVMKCANLAMEICIRLQEHQQALALCRSVLSALEYSSVIGSPDVGLEHLRLAQLAAAAGDARDAQIHLSMAYEILAVSHGQDHPLVSDVVDRVQSL